MTASLRYRTEEVRILNYFRKNEKMTCGTFIACATLGNMRGRGPKLVLGGVARRATAGKVPQVIFS